MKKYIIILWVVIMAIACKSEKNKENTPLLEVPVFALSEFNSKASEWVNKEVMVVGIADHVCKHGGKRLFLVDDEGDLHVDNDSRFDDAIVGNTVIIKGIVREFRVDEAYCLKEEENHIQKHKEGIDSDSVYSKKMESIKIYRDSMESAGVDHLSFYSIDYISHEVKK